MASLAMWSLITNIFMMGSTALQNLVSLGPLLPVWNPFYQARLTNPKHNFNIILLPDISIMSLLLLSKYKNATKTHRRHMYMIPSQHCFRRCTSAIWQRLSWMNVNFTAREKMGHIWQYVYDWIMAWCLSGDQPSLHELILVWRP